MRTLAKRRVATEEAKKRREEREVQQLSAPIISDKAAKLKPNRPVFERLADDAAGKESRHQEALVIISLLLNDDRSIIVCVDMIYRLLMVDNE